MLPLDGIRVLSFNHFLMGPLGIQMLGGEIPGDKPMHVAVVAERDAVPA